jgi:hypothetical protein
VSPGGTNLPYCISVCVPFHRLISPEAITSIDPINSRRRRCDACSDSGIQSEETCLWDCLFDCLAQIAIRSGRGISTLGVERSKYRRPYFAMSLIADLRAWMDQTEAAWPHSSHVAIYSGFPSRVFNDLEYLMK